VDRHVAGRGELRAQTRLADERRRVGPYHVAARVEQQQQAAQEEEHDDQHRRNDADEDVGDGELTADAPQDAPFQCAQERDSPGHGGHAVVGEDDIRVPFPRTRPANENGP
jgi:hypothetical protein